MKNKLAIFALVLLMACANKQELLLSKIASISEEMQKEEFPSRENMEAIIALYDEYISSFPEDQKVISFLELKAKYQAANGDYLAAIASYNDLMARFPESTQAADALFMQAFIYENDLSNLEAAQGAYEKFTEKFPEHELYDDAIFSLENLFLSEEEMFEKLIHLQDSAAK
ncbi:MAG: tetratricopeptide repeat protein [Chitinophagales bacterium]|nr:tetratricopeptide repeat protein [Chitinophagales bacterium]